MLDTLQVVMMTKPRLDPIPARYNAYISYLLEGFASLQTNNGILESRINAARVAQDRDRESLGTLSEEWLAKEAMYKAEIKRLEVIISKISPEKVEAVVAARSTSLVSRQAKDSKAFIERIQNAVEGKANQREAKYARDVPR
jgi:hypothetical protein